MTEASRQTPDASLDITAHDASAQHPAAEAIGPAKGALRADTEAENQGGSAESMAGTNIGASKAPSEIRASGWLLAALRSAVHVHVAEALETGGLNWSAARELTRVAVAENEREWLEVSRGKTVHQLEVLVAGKSPGDRPSSASPSDARRHVLRFEVAPETLALFREAITSSREAAPRSTMTLR